MYSQLQLKTRWGCYYSENNSSLKHFRKAVLGCTCLSNKIFECVDPAMPYFIMSLSYSVSSPSLQCQVAKFWSLVVAFSTYVTSLLSDLRWGAVHSVIFGFCSETLQCIAVSPSYCLVETLTLVLAVAKDVLKLLKVFMEFFTGSEEWESCFQDCVFNSCTLLDSSYMMIRIELKCSGYLLRHPSIDFPLICWGCS